MTYVQDGSRHTCNLFANSDLIGYFEVLIYKSIPSMNIHVEDDYRGNGFARTMVRELLKNASWDENMLLYIDTDASGGFWDRFGMVENTNGNGYEKVVAIKDIRL
jgi:GNAT superfamily N-acetyltransferase